MVKYKYFVVGEDGPEYLVFSSDDVPEKILTDPATKMVELYTNKEKRPPINLECWWKWGKYADA